MFALPFVYLDIEIYTVEDKVEFGLRMEIIMREKFEKIHKILYSEKSSAYMFLALCTTIFVYGFMYRIIDLRLTFWCALPFIIYYVFDDTSYVDAFEQELQKWRSTLGYDPDAEENKARYAEDKAEYIRQNLNRTEWSHMVDSAMAMQFVEFYDEAIGRWSE